MLHRCSQGYKLRPIIYLMLNLPCLHKVFNKLPICYYLVFRGILRTYVHDSKRIVCFRQKLGIKCICIICPRYLLHLLPTLYLLYPLLPLVNAGYITIGNYCYYYNHCYYHYTVTSYYYISLLRLCIIVVSCCSCIHCVISCLSSSLLLIALRLHKDINCAFVSLSTLIIILVVFCLSSIVILCHLPNLSTIITCLYNGV